MKNKNIARFLSFNILKLSFVFITLFAFSISNINISHAQVGDPDSNNSSCVTLDNNMRYRMRDTQVNNEVSDLQDYLIAEGYLSGSITGYFGVATLKAVKSFQSNNGLLASGYVGPITRTKIKSLSCDVANTNPNVPTPIVINPPVITPPVITPPVITPPVLKPGIVCTMEVRRCPDGDGYIPRDANCSWHVEMCKGESANALKVGIDSVTSYISNNYNGGSDSVVYNITLTGKNFNQVNYLEESHLADGTQSISRSSFKSATDNQIILELKVCRGCKYNSTFNAIDKNGIKSNSFQIQFDNTVPVPANALKASSVVLYNTRTIYAPGETIKFSVQGLDSNGQVATPAKGFNVQWHMYDMKDGTYVNNSTMVNGTYQADNAVYNYNTNMWDITAIAPASNLASGDMRKLEASFYCSNSSLGCYSNQIEKSFMFSVDMNTKPVSIKILNVLGNEMTNNKPLTIADITVGNNDLDNYRYNSLMLGKVNITKGKYQSIQVRHSCSTVTDSNGALASNYAISGTFNYGGGPSSFSCPADIQSMKGGADVTTVANIVKGVDTMDYTVVWSQAWGGPISIGVNAGGFQVYKNAPIGQLYFYGINADGSTEFLKSMTFMYSIKG